MKLLLKKNKESQKIVQALRIDNAIEFSMIDDHTTRICFEDANESIPLNIRDFLNLLLNVRQVIDTMYHEFSVININ